jgi:hypothetical protein
VSVPVALDELPALVAALGPEALLATVTPAGTPHVVSVVVTWTDAGIECGAGRRTAANLAGNPACALVFPVVDGEALRLIVDGTATVEGDRLRISPRSAIRHRRATPPD